MDFSKLQQRLLQIERDHWGGSSPLSERARAIRNRLRDLLDNRTIRLPYTPHGFDHVLEVDALAAEILQLSPPEGAIQREPYNLFIMVLAIWFHDAGLIQMSDEETPEQIRHIHHLRIGDILEKFFGDFLDNIEMTLIRDIGRNHCETTPEKLSNIRYLDRRILTSPHSPTRVVVYPRANSAILRLADILSITNTRTPWFLYQHLELNQTSLRHWKSHLSIESLYLKCGRTQEIETVVSISYSSWDLLHFIIHHVISKVEEEIRSCNPILKDAGLATFRLPVDLDLNEQGLGSEKAFSVLPSGLYDLLTSGLYGQQDVFIRELVQNGFDAITRLKALAGQCAPEEILVEVDYGAEPSHSKVIAITFRDYGIGMDQGDIDTYLLQIAAKASDNPDLNSIVAAAGLDPLLQEWGIGFLSAFAVTTNVTLRTHREGMRPVKLVFYAREGSSDPDGAGGGIHCIVEEDTEPLSTVDRGTEVRLSFTDGLDLDVLERLKHYIRFPPASVRYIDNLSPPQCEVLDGQLTKPGEKTVHLSAKFLRGAWIALADGDQRDGVTITQSGILVEEHVTDLLEEERLDIFGEIDCRSRFLKLPASRSQAIRSADSWKTLRNCVLQAIPECVRAALTDPICVNAALPPALSKVVDAAGRLPQSVTDSLLDVVGQQSFYRFDDHSKVAHSALFEAVANKNDPTIYLVSRGSTADGSKYLRGHYSANGVHIWMPATLAHSAKAELLRAKGKRLLPIAPKSWTLGSEGYENEWLIKALCDRAGVRVSYELLSDRDEVAAYTPLAKEDPLRQIWNKSDWSELGEATKVVCVAHRAWEFVFVVGSNTPIVKRLRELWIANRELRPLIQLLLHAYCESLRVNPDAVVETIEEFVEAGMLLRCRMFDTEN